MLLFWYRDNKDTCESGKYYNERENAKAMDNKNKKEFEFTALGGIPIKIGFEFGSCTDVDKMTAAQLEEYLEELEDRLDELEDNEPDEDDEDAYGEWEEKCEEIEELIEEVEERLDELRE